MFLKLQATWKWSCLQYDYVTSINMPCRLNTNSVTTSTRTEQTQIVNTNLVRPQQLLGVGSASRRRGRGEGKYGEIQLQLTHIPQHPKHVQKFIAPPLHPLLSFLAGKGEGWRRMGSGRREGGGGGGGNVNDTFLPMTTSHLLQVTLLTSLHSHNRFNLLWLIWTYTRLPLFYCLANNNH